MSDHEKNRHDAERVRPAARPGGDELTRKLRLGDPATDAPEIDGLELARMRRTIVAAADDAQDTRAGSWTWFNVSRPLAVAFATIVVALFAVWLFTPTLPDMPIEDPIVAEQIAPTELVSPPPTLEPQPIVQPEATAATTVADTSLPDRQTRTVQFTAPRGTRIIWTLDPNFESPLTEHTTRQEQ